MSGSPRCWHLTNLMQCRPLRALPAACLLLGVFATAGAAASAPSGTAGISDAEKAAASQLLEQYLRAFDSGSRVETGGSSPVAFEIDAALPKLRKHGILRGLRILTEAGRVAYTQLHFVGDEVIKTAVIARFLAADTKGRSGGEDLEITSRNYKFSYKGVASYNGRSALVFLTQPKRRQVGLFKGELWIDSETARPLREWGEFVKSPSVFLSRVYFVRDYDADSADSRLRRVIVRVHAAFAGPAELTMWLDEPSSATP